VRDGCAWCVNREERGWGGGRGGWRGGCNDYIVDCYGNSRQIKKEDWILDKNVFSEKKRGGRIVEIVHGRLTLGNLLLCLDISLSLERQARFAAVPTLISLVGSNYPYCSL